jgi:hypothetical protein
MHVHGKANIHDWKLNGGYDHDFEHALNDRGCSGLKHRYVWGTVAARPTKLGNGVGKFDVETGKVLTWQEEGAHAGRCHFLATGI